MDPLKSAQKKSSRHIGSYKHRHTQTTHLITSVPQSERTTENAFYINTKFVKANCIIRITCLGCPFCFDILMFSRKIWVVPKGIFSNI